MKIIKRALLLLFGFIFYTNTSKAAIGDTTIVTMHSLDSLTYYGNYKRSNKLPAINTYRRIFLLYTIGRYQCPAGSTYCGQWDYTLTFHINNYDTILHPKRVEIARAITPYSGTGSVFNTAWTHTYWIDVTDYAPILHDSCQLEALYAGYSGGFTLKTQLMFIEGMPEREPVKVTPIYDGYFNYGGATSIENNLPATNFTLSNNANSADALITITGHGSDNNYCSEFCEKYYQFFVNGTMQEQINFWKKCGFADIQAQTGTWIYDRSGWCPGEKVLPTHHAITGANSSTATEINMDVEPYTSPNGGAGFGIAANIVEYKNPTKVLDACIDDIITPSIKDDYKKYNFNCGQPQIVLKNSGSTTLNAATIWYGYAGQLQKYEWTGSLPFLSSTIITLPAIAWGNLLADSITFYATVTKPNNGVDENKWNDTFTSMYRKPPTLPNELIIRTQTNNTAVSSGLPYNETSWQLTDANGTIIKQRINNANSTVYTDTLNLQPGCYQLVVSDTGWADGLSFWVYGTSGFPAANNPGVGSISLRNKSGSLLTNGITKFNSKYYSGDFGSKFIYNFKVDFATNIQDYKTMEDEIYISPNPAKGTMQLNVAGPSKVIIKITDLNGKVVKELTEKGNYYYSIDINNFAAGLYNCIITQEAETVVRKLIIAE
jgi:hypothetical protein